MIGRAAQKLLYEINEVVAPKLGNIERHTATERERQVVAECLGFVSLIRYSVINIEDIKRLWQKSGLKFQ